MSAAESVTNVAIGLGVALAAQLVIFPLVGVEAQLSQNIQLAVAFTAVSLTRSYLVRRIFNWSESLEEGAAKRQGLQDKHSASDS